MAPHANFPWDITAFSQDIAQRLSNTVFFLNESVVGFANFYDAEIGVSGFIGNVIVAPQSRRQGLGKTIILHMLALGFNEHRFDDMRISCFGNNTPGLLLYKKLGFIPYGIEQRTDYKNKSVALFNFKLTAEQYAITSEFELNQISAKLTNI